MTAFTYEESLPDAAERYARDFGWFILPISAETKRPGFGHRITDDSEAVTGDPLTLGSQRTCLRGTCGHRHASNDPVVLWRWWAEAPDSWIGLLCAPSGLVVVDIDPRNGGRNPWQNGDQPDTWCARTRSGGTHLYFRSTPGAEYPAKLGNGVDLKHNGYTVVAPSPGYRWCQPSGPLASWPGRSFKAAPAYKGPRFEYVGTGPLSDEGATYLEPAVLRLRTALELGSDRNNSLYVLARQLGQLVAGGEAAEGPAREWLEATAGPLGIDGWRSTVRSGFKKGLEHDPPRRLRIEVDGLEFVDVKATPKLEEAA